MKLNIQFATVKSMIRFIYGRGKLSLGQVLFKLVKSMHILHFLLAFFTSTTFDSQFG